MFSSTGNITKGKKKKQTDYQLARISQNEKELKLFFSLKVHTRPTYYPKFIQKQRCSTLMPLHKHYPIDCLLWGSNIVYMQTTMHNYTEKGYVLILTQPLFVLEYISLKLLSLRSSFFCRRCFCNFRLLSNCRLSIRRFLRTTSTRCFLGYSLGHVFIIVNQLDKAH